MASRQENGRTVDRNADEIAYLLDLAAREACRAEIPEHQMIVGTVSLKLVAVRDEIFGKCLRVEDDLLRICLPRGIARLLQRGSDACNGLIYFGS